MANKRRCAKKAKSVKVKNRLKKYCLSNFCFLCLTNNHQLINLTAGDPKISLIDKLSCCVSELVYVQHISDVKICKICCDILRVLYEFKSRCLQKNKILVQYAKLLSGENPIYANSSIILNDEEHKEYKNIYLKGKIDFSKGKINLNPIINDKNDSAKKEYKDAWTTCQPELETNKNEHKNALDTCQLELETKKNQYKDASTMCQLVDDSQSQTNSSSTQVEYLKDRLPQNQDSKLLENSEERLLTQRNNKSFSNQVEELPTTSFSNIHSFRTQIPYRNQPEVTKIQRKSSEEISETTKSSSISTEQPNEAEETNTFNEDRINQRNEMIEREDIVIKDEFAEFLAKEKRKMHGFPKPNRRLINKIEKLNEIIRQNEENSGEVVTTLLFAENLESQPSVTIKEENISFDDVLMSNNEFYDNIEWGDLTDEDSNDNEIEINVKEPKKTNNDIVSNAILENIHDNLVFNEIPEEGNVSIVTENSVHGNENLLNKQNLFTISTDQNNSSNISTVNLQINESPVLRSLLAENEERIDKLYMSSPCATNNQDSTKTVEPSIEFTREFPIVFNRKKAEERKRKHEDLGKPRELLNTNINEDPIEINNIFEAQKETPNDFQSEGTPIATYDDFEAKISSSGLIFKNNEDLQAYWHIINNKSPKTYEAVAKEFISDCMRKVIQRKANMISYANMKEKTIPFELKINEFFKPVQQATPSNSNVVKIDNNVVLDILEPQSYQQLVLEPKSAPAKTDSLVDHCYFQQNNSQKSKKKRKNNSTSTVDFQDLPAAKVNKIESNSFPVVHRHKVLMKNDTKLTTEPVLKKIEELEPNRRYQLYAGGLLTKLHTEYFQCHSCEVKTTTANDLLRHIKQKHKTFIACKNCPKVFADKLTFFKHLESDHNKLLICETLNSSEFHKL